MLDRIRQFLPKYLVDKFDGVDIRQVDALPAEIRRKIIHGTDEESATALGDIKARERMQRVELIGDAALELLSDMRTTAEQSQLKNL